MAYLTVLLLFLASSLAKEICDTCIRVNQTCYDVVHLVDFKANFRKHVVIRKIAVLHSENTVFFNYEPDIADPEYYKVAYVNLDDPSKNGDLTDENNTHNFGTFDIEQDKSLVYLGGRDGIFTYGAGKKVNWYSSLGDDILILFFKTNLYIVKANDNRIIVKKGDSFNGVLDYTPIRNFVVNKDSVIVFLSTYGLFLNKKEETIWLSKNAFFRGLTVDLDGVVYTWWVDGIYKVVIEKNLAESTVVRVANLENIGALTFDNENNMLFSSGRALNRLTASNATVC